MGYVKKFNFASAGKPLMQLMLPNGKMLEIYEPTKGAMDKYIRDNADIQERIDAAKTGDELNKILQDLYDSAAELINFNTEGIRFTGTALANAYGIDAGALLEFFKAYADFILTITNQKN